MALNNRSNGLVTWTSDTGSYECTCPPKYAGVGKYRCHKDLLYDQLNCDFLTEWIDTSIDPVVCKLRIYTFIPYFEFLRV